MQQSKAPESAFDPMPAPTVEGPFQEDSFDGDQELFLTRVRLIHRQSDAAFFGTVVCIAAMVLLLGGVAAPVPLLVWALLASAALVMRFTLSRRFRKLEPGPAEAPRWLMIFRLGLLLTGAIWGSAGIVLYPESSQPHQVFIGFLLGGMATGSVATYSSLKNLPALFVVPALVPISIHFLIHPGDVNAAMGVMFLVYAGILLAGSGGMHGTITRSLTLQLQNRDLIAFLENSKQQADVLNAELLSEIEVRGLAESALRESEERYRSIVDSALAGVLIVDDEFRITYANEELANIFGWPQEEILNQDFRKFLDDESLVILEDRYTRRQRGEDVPSRYEVEIARKDGSRILTEFNTALIHSREGRPHTVAQVMDVTEQKRAEETMRMASRLEAIHTLAGGVAHDLNNLMAAVLGNAQLLRLKHRDDEQMSKQLGYISRAARQAGDLAQQLVGYARGGKYVPKVLSLNKIIEEIIHLQKPTRPNDVEIELDLDESLWNVAADASQMSQVMMNLCLNALESHVGTGRVRIATRNIMVDANSPAPDPDVAEGSYVLVEVSDTGSGMDDETRRRVFEPYFSTKRKGRGLGLAAAYGIVRNHEGHLAVESTLGKGTTFRAYIPMSEEPRTAATQKTAALPGGSETVLVIDDEQRVQEVLIGYLEILGYTALTASNGAEALDVARQYDGDIDLALLDMRMPVLDGANTFPILQNIRPATRVVICSGFDMDKRTQSLIDSGASGFIKKPITIKQFAEQVREALDD
jgi:PAS domain S-box-containing protein